LIPKLRPQREEPVVNGNLEMTGGGMLVCPLAAGE
jgi:hypothetical protein